MTFDHHAIDYRRLRRDESSLLGMIDRAEQIDSQYVTRAGRLELMDCRLAVRGWHPEELAAYIGRLDALLSAGGVIWGAWDGARLVGLSSLDAQPVGSDPAVMKLDMLYVSTAYRHRGIGKELTRRVANEALARGASGLYISATPTRNTVDTYLRMGASVLPIPDPELFALEPEDIHLLLPLTCVVSG